MEISTKNGIDVTKIIPKTPTPTEHGATYWNIVQIILAHITKEEENALRILKRNVRRNTQEERSRFDLSDGRITAYNEIKKIIREGVK